MDGDEWGAVGEFARIPDLPTLERAAVVLFGAEDPALARSVVDAMATLRALRAMARARSRRPEGAMGLIGALEDRLVAGEGVGRG